MNDITEATQWGSFALVSYIPDPLGSLLHELRQVLPGEDNPRPHITILPPRPLKLSVDAASQQAHKILLQFPAFDVELSKVCLFPQTNVLYLDVAEGNTLLHDVHAALNAGDLDGREEFDFLPHLTLSGPIASRDLPLVRRQAEMAWYSSNHARRFTFDEVALLWLSPDSPQGEWNKVWSHRLSTAAARAASATLTSQT